jgi:hypothetical protein
MVNLQVVAVWDKLEKPTLPPKPKQVRVVMYKASAMLSEKVRRTTPVALLLMDEMLKELLTVMGLEDRIPANIQAFAAFVLLKTAAVAVAETLSVLLQTRAPLTEQPAAIAT